MEGVNSHRVYCQTGAFLEWAIPIGFGDRKTWQKCSIITRMVWWQPAINKKLKGGQGLNITIDMEIVKFWAHEKEKNTNLRREVKYYITHK